METVTEKEIFPRIQLHIFNIIFKSIDDFIVNRLWDLR